MRYACLLLFLLTAIVCRPQSDYLKILLKRTSTDSVVVKLCIEISYSYSETNLDSAFLYASKAESRFDNLSIHQQTDVYELLGILNSIKGKNDLALEYFLKQLKITEANNLIAESAGTHISIANTFERLGENKKAVVYFEKALVEAKKTKDNLLIEGILGNVSTFYFNQQKYDTALLLWKERLKYKPQLISDIDFISGIGDMYRNNKQYATAEIYYLNAIAIAMKNNNAMELATMYNNYALIPLATGNIDLAISYYRKAKHITDSLGALSDLNSINGRLASALFEDKQYEAALTCVNEAITFYLGNHQINALENLYELKSNILLKLPDYKGAYENIIEAKKYKEELLNTQTQKKLSELQASIVEEQKNKEIVLMDVDRNRQKLIRNISIAGSILLIFLSGIIYNKNRNITLQKQETEKQKKLVERKQHEIIESITYAKRLQEAILPSHEFISRHVPDNFILYQPKDIVAGDFYWAEKIGTAFFIAAADSTGHGVPGAMVSVVCSTALNRAVKEFGITETGKILDKARELVLETFDKSAADVKDGMDISLLCIDTSNKKITWSGANNPLWYAIVETENKELIFIKADKQPVGKTEYPKPFTTHQIKYRENTTFYLFTDGLPDQFGGPAGKKFKYKQFSELLLDHAHLPLPDQKEIIATTFSAWKSDLEQVDDVCVIGIRI